ncbi:hypothetical protein EIP91_004027 [Steccherinum ochraceum]|uniref:GH16 domain-containing protein n=1 Tax=Steccherinum ochraceum TaxID=92696 RepID=A0A4R0RI16_9APHY|nr:hypothetical protein EIP91_004027 [Steccherinum ochraceum]
MSYGRALGLSLLAASLVATNAQNNTKYALVNDFSGSNFFSGFRYNASAIDSNNFGNVHFIDQADAVSGGLTSVDSNQHAIIKVDNTTNGAGDPAFGRNSVYLISNDPLQMGSLLIADINHIPLGCSVWPGLFTQGANWPTNGEIDIVENVNQATINQYSLHVGQTCNQPASAATQQSGKTTGSNCTVVPALDINSGCIVQETKQNSFGAGFAQAGGGVYAMQWNEQGVSIWFFSRGDQIPSDISSTNNSPDPTGWGLPSAFYPADGCDPSTVFGPQFITIYIDICGAFAGQDQVFASTCGSVAPNCTALVPDPANYANAFWDINYIRTFSTNPPNTTTGSTSTGAGGSSPTSGSNSGSNNSGSGSSSDAPASGLASALLIPVAAMLFGLLTLV